MSTISQVIHNCETRSAIKWVKPLWCGGWCLKYKYRESWQIDHITLCRSVKESGENNPQMSGDTLCASPHCPEHHAAPWKATPLRHSSRKTIDSNNGTHCRQLGQRAQNSIWYTSLWCSICWNAMDCWKTPWKQWDLHLAKVTLLVNISWGDPSQSKPPYTLEENPCGASGKHVRDDSLD